MPDTMVAARGSEAASGTTQQVDVAVVGAGFAGLYLLHRLRKAGFTTVVLEEADDVGGTWYWNRYPGARCDIQTIDYTYTFDPELESEWKWSEKYATQPEILRYLGFVADRYDLRRDIRFRTKVTAARWDQATERWLLTTDNGASVSCRYYIMATGCLSAPKPPEIDGVNDFKGEVYFTGRWPHEEVKLAGKRVAVIGTGSSGIQAIPLIAEQAAHLTVFQRTPSFAIPAQNGPPPADRVALLKSDRASYRAQARDSLAGVPWPQSTVVSWQLSDAERRERFETAWAAGDLVYILTQLWADQGVDFEGNAVLADLVREKIREIVKNPETAAALTPHDHPFGAKRPCLDTNYYATYNRPNVTLVNLRQEPIKSITASGIKTDKRTFDLDVIVFATGFDAMTGAIMAVHPITGRGGKSLSDVWANGPQTYLGLTVAGFPNLFMITGPGSPSVLSNMAVSIEQHVDWVVDRLIAMREAGFTTIEATETAQAWLGPTHGRLLDAHTASAGQHLVHGRQRPRQGARRDALYRRRRSLPQHLQRGRQPRHAGLQAHRPQRRRAVQRRPDRSPATGRAAGAEHAGGHEVTAAGMFRSPGCARLSGCIQCRPSCRPAGRRGRRRHTPRRRRFAALPSLSAGDAGATSDRGLFPWRRLGVG